MSQENLKLVRQGLTGVDAFWALFAGDRRYVQVRTFRRGRIIRWEMFPDRAAALEAVGLRE